MVFVAVVEEEQWIYSVWSALFSATMCIDFPCHFGLSELVNFLRINSVLITLVSRALFERVVMLEIFPRQTATSNVGVFFELITAATLSKSAKERKQQQ